MGRWKLHILQNHAERSSPHAVHPHSSEAHRRRALALGRKSWHRAGASRNERGTAMTGDLIVGLDVSTRNAAEDIISRLGDSADYFKIGYQLFYGGDGLTVGKELIKAGKKVFFDLKLLDIDNTVEKGVAAFAATGAAMLTLHAYPKAMEA